MSAVFCQAGPPRR